MTHPSHSSLTTSKLKEIDGLLLPQYSNSQASHSQVLPLRSMTLAPYSWELAPNMLFILKQHHFLSHTLLIFIFSTTNINGQEFIETILIIRTQYNPNSYPHIIWERHIFFSFINEETFLLLLNLTERRIESQQYLELEPMCSSLGVCVVPIGQEPIDKYKRVVRYLRMGCNQIEGPFWFTRLKNSLHL